MAILTHGSDLTLSPTLAAIVHATDGSVRTAIHRLARQQFQSVQLDATLPGIRPRELDTRGRKDLLALVGRAGLRISGLDLFIPRKHFTSTEHVDRAMSAALAAIQMAGELGRVPVSVALPIQRMAEELRVALVEAADGRGVRLAVHAEDQLDALLAWVEQVGLHTLGAAIDPAALLALGHDPAAVVQRFAGKLAVARLSDLERGSREDADDDDTTRGETTRCAAGAGDLDLAGYRLAVDLTGGRSGPVVLDLRSLRDPLAAADAGRQAWDDAGVSL